MRDPGLISIERPATVDAALGILAAEQGGSSDVMPLAGGTDVMPWLKRDALTETLKSGSPAVPVQGKPLILVSLARLGELDFMSKRGRELLIGSRATLARLACDPLVSKEVPVVAEAASQMASPQIRNRGTVGGNIMNASPAADTVPPFLALDAGVVLRSVRGERRLPLTDLLKEPGKTRAGPDELLTALSVPLDPERPLQFFRRLAARRSLACAKVSVAFCAALEHGRLKNVRIAFGAVGSTVLLAGDTAALLEGRRLSAELAGKAAASARNEVFPISDVRSTEEYRRSMAGELLKEGLEFLLRKNK